MLSKPKASALLAAFITAFWFTLNDSMATKTRNDCNAGIARACRSLQ